MGKSLADRIKEGLGGKAEKDAADIGAAAQETVIEEKEEEPEGVLLKDKKAKLKENIAVKFQSDSINMKNRIWYHPNVEMIFKKGTEVKLIKETNAGMLIDVPMVEFGSIRISVPLDILIKQKSKSRL